MSLRAEPGHITPGCRASLVDAVLDLPEVQQSARVEAAFRLGDGESLRRLQERCEDVSTRPAGWSALFDANLPSGRAGQHVPGSAGQEPCRAHNDVRGDRPVRQRRRRRASTKPASTSACSAASSSAVTGARATRRSRTAARLKPGPPRLRSLSQQNERSRRYPFRNPEFTFRWQNSHRSSKTAQVLGLQRHGRAQGTLGLFKSEIPRGHPAAGRSDATGTSSALARGSRHLSAFGPCHRPATCALRACHVRCSRGSKPALASGSQVAAGGDRGPAPRRSTRTPVRALPGKASCAWVANATWNALPAMGKPHHEHPRLDQRPGDRGVELAEAGPRPPRPADGSAAPRPAPGPSRARPGGAPRRAIPSPPRTSRRARRPAAARPAAPCAAACAARPGRRAARSRSPPRTHRSPPAPAAHTPYAAAGPRWPAPGAPCAGARDGSRPAPGPTARQPPVTSDLLEQLPPRPRHPRPPHRRYRRGKSHPGWGQNSRRHAVPTRQQGHHPGGARIREEQRPSRGQLR